MNKKISTWLLAITSTVILTAFVIKQQGVDLSAMDRKADPKKDFYQFANGNWLKAHPIPESESHYGSFHEVEESNMKILRVVMESVMEEREDKSETEIMLGHFFKAALDSAHREEMGIEYIKPFFEEIDNIKSTNELIQTTARLHTFGIHPFFALSVMPDARESKINAAYLWQSGMGLPEKSYYTGKDERTAKIREAYLVHLEKTFTHAGYDAAKATEAAKHVFSFEKALAASARSSTELRDVQRMYNKYTIDELSNLGNTIPWTTYLNEAGLEIKEYIIVGQPEFMRSVDSLLAEKNNLPKMKEYMKWHVLKATASKLNTALDEQNFSFYGTTLYGIKTQKPRWKRSIAIANEVMGDAVGQIYVEKALAPGTRERVDEMVENLTQAFRARIDKVTWMSDETREKARLKLDHVQRKLAFPDEFKSYSGLDINPDSYVMNWLNAVQFAYRKQAEKIGQEVDKNEWSTTPQTINAFYSPLHNEIVFPAAIMQPPFFYPEADDAVNYGSMGAVIGHELTHGFDDMGSMFNEEGNMENWWNDADKAQFNRLATKLETQFNAYEVEPGVFVNGKLTLGENIADLGGVLIAYDALQLAQQKKPLGIIDGFTPEQRFFISYAQVWRSNARPEFLRTVVRTDPHSPSKTRVIGTLSNIQAFYDAFAIKEGDPLYKPVAERVVIW